MTSTLPFELNGPTAISDGDLSSFQNLPIYIGQTPEWHQVRVDLGSVFWVDGYRHMLQFGWTHARTLPEWGLDFSDGTREVDGSLKWDRKLFDETPFIRSRIVVLDEADFEPIKARYVRLQWLTHPDGTAAITSQLAEVQVFGEGYQPEVTLTSDLIRLRGSRNLFAIEWDADTPPGTEVALQTRTGARLDTTFHYFRIVGEDTVEIVRETEEEAKKVYDKLRLGKGPIVPELVAAGDWEPWSEPYTDPEGSAITSPSPRELSLIHI